MTDALEQLRPWGNVADVTAALERWMHRSGWGGNARTIALGSEVAQHLRAIGHSAPHVPTDQIVFATLVMLGNVVQGRAPTDDDLLRRTIRGVPERTLRHYRKVHGPDAFHRYLETLQHDLDVAALVNNGRTIVAARAWLRANPGKHAKDAPAPRRRAA